MMTYKTIFILVLLLITSGVIWLIIASNTTPTVAPVTKTIPYEAIKP